jgi:hypothetical protein
MKSLTIMAITILLGGCVSMTQQRAQLSAGRVGCKAEALKIVEEESWSWVAVCKEKRWICSGGTSIECKPLDQ